MPRKKLLAFMLTAATAITAMPVGAFAEGAIPAGGGIQEIESSSLADNRKDVSIPVQYTVGATFTVKLPSAITLSNTDGSWGYSGQVGVKGDIDSGKVVNVTPAESVTMYDVTCRPTDGVPASAEDQAYDHKAAKNASVAQTKTSFAWNEINPDTYTDTDLVLTAGTMQSGKWKGELNVNISYGEYVEAAGLYGSDGSFTPWSTLVNDGKIPVADNVIQTRHDNSMEGRLVIEDGITSLGVQAFVNCSNLTNINIPESVTSIEYYAFAGCSKLTNINIPESVTSIGDHAFYECSSMTGITIPGRVTSIGENAFNNCKSLTSVDIPNGVTSIKAATFSGCSNLTGINIPESVTRIENSAFSGCSNLTGITIPDSVTTIEGSVFMNCSSLTSVTIPGALKHIFSETFAGCSNLTHITIPSSVTYIDMRSFYGCSNLTDVTFAGTKEQWSTVYKANGKLNGKPSSWKDGLPATVVHCSDGDVPI